MKTIARIWPFALICLMIFLVSGCQSSKGLKYTPKEGEVTQVPVQVSSGSYMDFEDIQIPSGLVLERKKSYLYQTGSVKTGVLSFKTSRSTVEVLDYFKENMPQDNWVPVSVFKFRKNIMLFNKANKNCLIIIEMSEDDSSNVEVEIWVSPQGVAKKKSSFIKKIIDK
ncbi:MAG: hypothetical protein JRG97_03290 [Deltaproteobacteria bacterium]|nr:hypothetical protein [Deltaproteobacteria bacterium]MBW2051997.1 hypothetical protein [Deltaproteobacteria bacterium]MBW2140082.1 hypothetical protein [Deltaproteobacteria bacterium]MBW2323753.1 hypothetical protein [Deltaproteobacteria bacterium]